MAGAHIIDGVVKPEWIDANGHMNVAYYLMAFDIAGDALWDRLGITDEYVRSTNHSTFAVECHITYQRELVEADAYAVTAQMIAYDEKRIHQFQRMYHAEEKYLVATIEWMNLHVDLGTRRVTPWPDEMRDVIGEWARQQPDIRWPGEAGQKMQIRKPLYSLAENSPL